MNLHQNKIFKMLFTYEQLTENLQKRQKKKMNYKQEEKISLGIMKTVDSC